MGHSIILKIDLQNFSILLGEKDINPMKIRTILIDISFIAALSQACSESKTTKPGMFRK